jgi:hypothetical protein
MVLGPFDVDESVVCQCGAVDKIPSSIPGQLWFPPTLHYKLPNVPVEASLWIQYCYESVVLEIISS